MSDQVRLIDVISFDKDAKESAKKVIDRDFADKSDEYKQECYKTLAVFTAMLYDRPYIDYIPRDWTPCTEGLPTKDGAYDVTIKSPFGRYYIEQNARFENGEWLTESDTGTVLAWMPPINPYNPDHIREAGKEADDQ